MRAASYTNGLRDRCVREQLFKCRLIDMSRMDSFVGHRRRLVFDWVNFSRAAQNPHAAQVDVSLLFEVVESETL